MLAENCLQNYLGIHTFFLSLLLHSFFDFFFIIIISLSLFSCFLILSSVPAFSSLSLSFLAFSFFPRFLLFSLSLSFPCATLCFVHRLQLLNTFQVRELHFRSNDIESETSFFDGTTGKKLTAKLKTPRLQHGAISTFFVNVFFFYNKIMLECFWLFTMPKVNHSEFSCLRKR